MAATILPEYMKELSPRNREQSKGAGPFLTISRQYGCYGFSLGLLIQDILNESAPGGREWRIYHREILSRLAQETHVDESMIERSLTEKPSLVSEFISAFSTKHEPSSFEIRNRIAVIIRMLAMQGRAIILGQGAAAATSDLSNGLSIRLEAPEEWRAQQIAFREDIGLAEARSRLHHVEQEFEYVRHIYNLRYPRRPAYDITYDCSSFTLTQIARNVVGMMKLTGCV